MGIRLCSQPNSSPEIPESAKKAASRNVGDFLSHTTFEMLLSKKKVASIKVVRDV